jgi:peptidoglycan hydrolase CwlO-like protein
LEGQMLALVHAVQQELEDRQHDSEQMQHQMVELGEDLTNAQAELRKITTECESCVDILKQKCKELEAEQLSRDEASPGVTTLAALAAAGEKVLHVKSNNGFKPGSI